MKMPDKVRYFNKRYLNKLTTRVARSSWGPFCMIHHIGRYSGKPYETPIIAFPIREGFVIALTYGPGVDWYRNARKAGRCQIQWHGKIYEIDKIEPLKPRIARAYLPFFFRTVLGLVGLRDYVKMESPFPPVIEG